MVIQNSSKPTQVRIRAFLLTLFFATSILLIYTTGLLDKGLWIFSQHQLTLIALLLYLIPAFYFYALNNYYVYIYLDKQKLIIRYYSLRPLGSAKKSVEILLTDLLQIELKSSFFGKKTDMIVYQKVKDKVAVYAPISLSGYNAHQMKKFKKAFQPVLKKEPHK